LKWYKYIYSLGGQAVELKDVFSKDFKHLDKLINQGLMKKEYKDAEIYIKLEDGSVTKEIRKAWVYETI